MFDTLRADMSRAMRETRNDPDWKKLSSNPRYAYDQIVTNISNLLLSPLDCSQI